MLIVTVKPRADALERVAYAASQGIAVFRINFARHSIALNVELLHAIRGWANSRRLRLELLADLPGPKARLGFFVNDTEDLLEGQCFTLRAGDTHEGNAMAAGLSDLALFDRLQPHDTLALADGTVHLRVVGRTRHAIDCVVIKAGRIHSRCGVIAACRYAPNHMLTPEDRRVARAVAGLVDIVCPSFADGVDVVEAARDAVGKRTRIVAKIESPVGVRAAARLAHVAQGLMLARGDLRAFYPPAAMREVGSRLRQCTAAQGRTLVCASNYFTSVARGTPLSRDERDELSWTMQLAPDYLLVNETSHSPYWRQVIDAAVRHWMLVAASSRIQDAAFPVGMLRTL